MCVISISLDVWKFTKLYVMMIKFGSLEVCKIVNGLIRLEVCKLVDGLISFEVWKLGNLDIVCDIDKFGSLEVCKALCNDD